MKKKVSKLKPSKSKKNNKPVKPIKAIKPVKVVKQKAQSLKNPVIKVNAKKKDHYVDAEQFRLLIIDCYKKNVLSTELAECISKIANKLSFHPRFINYTYKEEMVGDAIEKMLKAVRNKKYNPEAGNAFAYFTRITYNAFFNRINKERKEKEFILNLQDTAYTDMENAGFDMSDEYPEEKYYE